MQFHTNTTSQRSLGTRRADPKMYTRINDFTWPNHCGQLKALGRWPHSTEMNTHDKTQ